MPRWRVADDPSECYRDRRNYVPRFQDRRSLSPETSWSRKEHFKEVHRGYRTEGNEFRFASHKRERSEQSRHYSDYDDYSETYRKRRTDFHDYDRDSRVSLRDRNNDCYYEKSNEGHSSREQQFSTKDYSYRTRKENSEFKRCKSDFNRHKEDYSSSSVAKDEVGFRNDREIPNPLHSVDQKSSERISHKIPDERLNVNIKGNMAELRKQEVVFDNSKPNRVSEDLIKIQPLKQSAALQKKELTLVKDFQMPPSPNLRGNMRSEEHSSELVKKNENAQNISTSDSVFIPKKKQSVLGIGKWRRVENDQSKAEPPSALHSASKGSGSIDHSVQDDGTHPSKGNDVTSFVHMSSSRLKEHRLTSTSPQREHRLTIEISQKEHRLTNEFPQKDCHNSNASLAGYRNNFNDTLKSDYISLSQVSDLEKKDMSHIDEADHVAGCEKSRSTPVEICSFLKSIEDQTEENACILQNNTDNSSLFAFKDLLRSPQSEYGYFFEPRVLPVLLKDTPVYWDKSLKVRFGIQQPMPKKFYECGENPRKVKNAGDLYFPLPKKKDIQAPIDFTLPYDIFFQCCMETLLDKARKTWTDRAQCPEPFIVQTKTVFSDISTRKPGYHERCQCDPKGSDCDDSCINRMMFVECTLKNCSLRGKCTNRVISSKNWCKVSAKQCGDKGWGLFAEEFIPKSRFIIEYVGEMISSAECEHRISMHYADETKFYMLSLESSDVIDATRFGSFARFTNHSCDPNAACQNWFVKDRSRIGIFAIRDISKGEEITFNYQFQRFGDVKHKCLCGSSKCRGYLGAKNPPRRNVAKSSIKEIKRFDQEALSLENSKSLITLLNSDDVPEDSNPFRHHSIPTFLARNLEEGKNYRKEQLREKFSADDCKNLINAFK